MKRLAYVLTVAILAVSAVKAGQPTQTARSCERQLCDELRSCSNGSQDRLKQKVQQGNKAETSQGVLQTSTCRQEAVGSYQDCSNLNSCLKVKPQGNGTEGSTSKTTPVVTTTKRPSGK